MEKIYEIIAKNFRKVMFALIMILLIISFGMWGISDVVRKLSSTNSEVAEIAGSKLSTTDIDNNFRNYLKMVGNGNSISIEDGIKAGLLDQSIKKITSEIALNKEAKKVGIEVNEDLVIKILKEDSYFKDEDGNFNKDLFQRVVAYSGYGSERGFLNALKQEKARITLLNIVKSGVSEIKYKQDLLRKYDSEVRSANYVLLPFEPNKVSYTYEELNEYYKSNIDKYLTPELKDISIVMISREDFKDENLSDEEVEDEVLSKVNIADDLLVEDVSIEDIASELGVKVISLKDVNIVDLGKKEQSIKGIREILGTVNDMTVSGEKTISEIKETTNGDYYIVRIDATKGKNKLPLEKVKDEVSKAYIKDTAEEIKRKEGVNLVKDINDNKITLEDVAKKYGVKEGSIKDVYRRPDLNINNDNINIVTPIVLAQIFTKDKVGEAGIAIKDNGILVFSLSDISYKEDSEKENVNSKYNKRDKEYLVIETFADALLNKYKFNLDHKVLDKMYNVDNEDK